MGFLYFLFSFRGRINRMQYWWYGIIINIPAFIMWYDPDLYATYFTMLFEWGVDQIGLQNWMYVLWALAFLLIWSGFAVTVKRFHDRGKSGWWILIILVPVLGALWMLVELYFFPSQQGANKYGYAAR